uniref:C-type lectin domain-containing protein n=1 Tax=Oryzias latipes TaxID=8090 RepID=A0A3P9IJS4_ORYLA
MVVKREPAAGQLVFIALLCFITRRLGCVCLLNLVLLFIDNKRWNILLVSTDRSRPGSNMDPPLTFVSPHPVQQNSYELQLETRSWLDAQSFCRLNHADLANVTSPAEGEKVKALLQRDGVEQAWFGLHRDSWVWTDGSATSYTSWLAGQPNNAGGSQGCVYMEKEKWNDFPCTNQYYTLTNLIW